MKLLPQQVKDHATSMNNNKQLLMGIDHNTNDKLFRRIKKQKKSCSYEYFAKILEFFLNLYTNLVCIVILNVQIIFINYFSPFIAFFVQFIGFYNQVQN